MNQGATNENPAEEPKLNELGQRFGTKKQPREVVGTFGQKSNPTPATTSSGEEQQSFGTKDAPRLVSSSGKPNKEIRVVSRGPRTVVRMAPRAAPKESSVTRGVSQVKRPNQSLTPVGRIALAPVERAPGSQEDQKSTQGFGTKDVPRVVGHGARTQLKTSNAISPQGTLRHYQGSMRAVAALPDERVVVLNKGVADAVRRFLKTRSPIRQNFIPALIRCVGESIRRTPGEAARWGKIEVAICVKHVDLKALTATCRRLPPPEEARARLLAAFELAFQRDRDADAHDDAGTFTELAMTDGAEGALDEESREGSTITVEAIVEQEPDLQETSPEGDSALPDQTLTGWSREQDPESFLASG